MQIIELYIKGYKRIDGAASSTATDKLIDSTATFNSTAEVGDLVTNIFTNEFAFVSAIDSDTQLTLTDNIFTSNDVYRLESDYFRVDLFEDESVVITESLVNVRDIAKVFTPFSQQFNLPASKTNNKLFRHYENTDVENSFDARFRHNAIIKLNGIDYRKGQIQFKSVTLKDNKAYAYKVVFFGDTVELKEILGDAKLSSLNYGDLDFEYNETNIIKLMCNTDSEITTDFGSTDILVPNIHHSKNMRYDTVNGYRDNITGEELEWTDVKPAIRIKAIIEAINRTYTGEINLTGFFESTVPGFNDVYMWMHRNEGYITNAEEGGGVQIIRNRFRHSTDIPLDWTHSSTTPATYGDPRSLFLTSTEYYQRYKVKANVFTTSSESYTIRIRKSSDDSLIAEYNATTGGNTFALGYISQNNISSSLVDFYVEVSSENTIAISSQTLEITFQRRSTVLAPRLDVWTATYNAATPTISNTFDIAKQIPDMKIMDFLSGLFKMYNLVVYKSGNNIITSQAPFFMSLGNDYDITKYVDMESANMERLFQYKEMDFKFKSKKSFLVQFADEINGVPFAEESYGDNKWDGGVYKVELPFEKMMYERLTDEDGNLTTIGQGAFLNKKFEPTIGEPLLLSMYRTSSSQWSMRGTANTNYRRPSQLTGFPPGAGNRLALNFGEEVDEYLLEIPSQTENLFNKGYFDYVDSVFDRKARLLKVSAYLPLSILTKLKMNDRLVIANKSYRINKYKTNLLTNKTDLELYNKDEYVSQLNNNQVAFLGRVADITISNIFKSRFDVSWDAVSGADGYNVYVNGSLFSEKTTGTSETVTGLDAETSYDVSVRVKYDVDGEDAFSFDTGETVKTNNITPP